jgi:predicted permease
MSARVSQALYRVLLRAYPREFRERFADDLQADFDELAARAGLRAAWSRTFADLARSLPSTHRHARDARRRLRIVTLDGERPMGSMLFDLRHATRALLKAPVFTVVTILTLALGIGANSAIFSLVNAVLIRPMGYVEPDRLMLIHEAIPQSNVARFGVSPPDFIDLTQYQQSFTAIGAYRTRAYEMSGTGEPEQVTGVQVTFDVFDIVGVPAAIGRTFRADDSGDGEAVVVLSHGLWQRRFGARAVLGERLLLDRQPYTIVGVMPNTFQFPKRGAQFNGEPAELWTPLVFNPFERQARGMMYNHSVVGRLRDGVTLEQAAADTSALAARVRENYPPALRNSRFTVEINATPLFDEVVGQVRRPLLILLGAVGLVLLVACANVANLVLSRAVTREREIGVRAALGAARYRLFQMLLMESVMLAVTGGAIGLLLGHWVLRLMPAVLTTSLPGVEGVTLDARVVAFTFGLSAVTAVIFSIVPLIAAKRRDLNDLLREGAARSIGGRRQHRVQASLVVSSIAFAFVLLVGAGLLIRSFNNLVSIDSGIRPANILTMEVVLPPAGYAQPEPIRSFYKNLYEQLRVIPGVRSASVSTDLPLVPDGERRSFWPERTGEAGGMPPSVAVTWIHGNYFGTFGVPLARGRDFSPVEASEDRQVAIVSRALAERFWPGEDPIGKQLRWGLATSTAPLKTIVGVAGDVVDGALGTEPIIHVYVPYSEVPDRALAGPIAGLVRRMTIAVHSDTDPFALVGPVRNAVASLDRALAISDIRSMSQIVEDATAPQRFSAMVLTAFAAGAVLLAGIGLYGVLAFGVAQRTREIGVRLALGARRGEVIRLIVRQGMTLAGIGLLIGAAGALASTQLMRALLFETDARDPWTFALVPVVLALVAFIASYVPARRAARVEPMAALRSE